MRIRILVIFAMSMLTLRALASPVVGKVTDESGSPVSYASVYFADKAKSGVITDLSGTFNLEKGNPGDYLVVSFIGYETVTFAVDSLPVNGDTLYVTLKEQPILLAEALVVNSKPSKKMTRKQKKELLSDVRAQMEEDFPDEFVRYKIVSDYAILNEGQIVAFEELSGNLIEMPVMKKSGKKDSIQLKADYCKRYRNLRTEQKLESIEDNARKEERRRMAQRVDSSVMIHRTMWGSGVKWFFDELAKYPGRWELVEQGDVSVLTYRDKKSFFGIVKYELTVNYIIDPYSYRLQKLSQKFTASANIPFGYKLDQDMLDVFNMLNISGDEVEKFRLKKMDANVQRNILYNRDGRRTYVSEKNVLFDIDLQDRKGQGFELHNTALINVLAHEAGVRPYTKSELNANFPTVVVDVSEAK